MKTINVFSLSQKEIRERFTIEWCPWCDSERIIFAQGTTRCPVCNHVLIPCSTCIDTFGDCLKHEDCPYAECEQTPDEFRQATNIPLVLTDEETAFLYKNL